MLLDYIFNLALLCRVFIPSVDVLGVFLGVMMFYIFVTLSMGGFKMKELPLFITCIAAVLVYMVASFFVLDGANMNIFYMLSGASLLAFRWETYHKKWKSMSTRRKLMISTWNAPSEGNIYGSLSIDITKTLSYIQKKRETTKEKITITHIIIKAVSRVLAECPSVNGRLVLGRYYEADSADVTCLVNIETPKGPDLANAKIENAYLKPMEEIATDLVSKTTKFRKGKDEDFNKSKPLLSLLPTFVLQPVVFLIGWMGSLGMSIPVLGVKPYPFGTAIITSVGMLGLDAAFVPFTPFARVALMVVVGAMKKIPIVDPETNAIVVQDNLPITVTVDHRYMDGSTGASMAKLLRKYVSDPAEMDKPVQPRTSRKSK